MKSIPATGTEASTLEEFLDRVENLYGRARRTWLMDRGIPTERTLERMRAARHRLSGGHAEGTADEAGERSAGGGQGPSTRVGEGETARAREEFYIYVESRDRVLKERSMRRRKLKRLWARLGELRGRKKLSRDRLLLSLGAVKKEADGFGGCSRCSCPPPTKPSTKRPSASSWTARSCAE